MKHIGNIRIRSDKLPLLRAEQEAFRRDLALMNKENRKLQEQTIKTLDAEGQFYHSVLVDCFSRNGFAWIPGSESIASRGKRVRKPKIQEIQFSHCFTQEERIYFKVEISRHRFPIGAISMLPYKTKITEALSEQMRIELSFYCGREVTFKLDEFKKGAWVIVNRSVGVDGIPLLVRYADVVDVLADNYEKDYYACPVVVGVGQHRASEILTFKDHPHWLVAGTSGGGKSNLINSMIVTWLRFVHPDDLKLILIDLKRVEFKLYKAAPHLSQPVISDGEEAVAVLTNLMDEIDSRNRLLESHDEKELAEWNRNHPNKKLPRIVVIIDELAELMLSAGPQVRHAAIILLQRISNLGRAVGVNIIVATQHPTKEVVPSRVTANMTAAISVRASGWRQSVVILGDGQAAKLPNVPGRVLYKYGSNFIQLQTPLVDLETVKDAVRIAKGHAAGVLNMEEQTPFLEPEGMICWIADNLEGRLNTKAIAERGHAMGIPLPQLRALMADLVNRPRIEAKGREFEICPMEYGWRLEEVTPKIDYHLEAEATLQHLTGETPDIPVVISTPEVVEPPQSTETEAVETPEPGPARTEIDPLKLDDEGNFNRFMDLHCIVDPQSEITAKDFYNAYASYCDEFLVHRLPKQAVGKYITKRNFLIQRGAKGITKYVGISLKVD